MHLKGITRAALIATAVTALAACASDYDIEGARVAQPSGAAFENALHTGYLEYAGLNQKEGDWIHSTLMIEKARQAGAGTAPELDPAATDAQKTGRSDLIAAIPKARVRAPEIAATTQIKYDCWVREVTHQNVNLEDPDPNLCQAAFAENMDKIRPVPLAKMLPAPMSVYFDSGETTLDAEDKAVIAKAAAETRLLPDEVVVVGYADGVGTRDINRDLATKRAEAVAEALRQAGVSSALIKVRPVSEVMANGKNDPEMRRVDFALQDTVLPRL